MAQIAMTVRMDNQQKAQFDKLCEQFGMSANTAINIFVKAVIRSKSIPFSIQAKNEEEDEVTAKAKAAFKELRAKAERGGRGPVRFSTYYDAGRTFLSSFAAYFSTNGHRAF